MPKAKKESRQFIVINEEQLISEVEKRSILYDKALKGYRKPAIRETAWEEVATIVKSSGNFFQITFCFIHNFSHSKIAEQEGTFPCEYGHHKRIALYTLRLHLMNVVFYAMVLTHKYNMSRDSQRLCFNLQFSFYLSVSLYLLLQLRNARNVGVPSVMHS